MHSLKDILKEHYQIDAINVSSQQGGWAALAYKVFSNQQTYFLKVYEKRRASTPKWTALIDQYVPIMVWLMNNSRLKGKIPAPLLTKNGDYKCEDDNGIYMLYEYIDGETVGEKELTEDQVCQLSEILTELHLYGEELPFETAAMKEDFDVPFLQQLRDIVAQEVHHIPNELRQVISPHTEHIKSLVDTVEELSELLKSSPLRMVLCHTDLHNWNLMQSEQQLILIDWEGLKIAPVEADMMSLVDKPYYKKLLSIYKKTHQNFVINPDALKFYQGRRKLEDIWEFIEQVLFDKQDEQEKAVTLNYLTEELKSISH